MKDISQKIATYGSLLAQLVVYACFAIAYFFLVLHVMGDWVKHVYDEDKPLYAVLALALILVQGVVLERLTSILPRLFRRNAR